MYRVVDDYGFLAIIDSDAYPSFLQEHWSLDQLIEHLKIEMLKKRLLIWGTGCEGYWNIKVSKEKQLVTGFREITGPILVTNDKLCLVNWTSITAAASYDDVILPKPKDVNLIIPIDSGLYNCRVVQMFNPMFDQDMLDDDSSDNQNEVNFYVELVETEEIAQMWTEIPWSDVG